MARAWHRTQNQQAPLRECCTPRPEHERRARLSVPSAAAAAAKAAAVASSPTRGRAARW